MVYIGVDPGKSGAFAVMNDNGERWAAPWSDEGFVIAMKSLTTLRDRDGEKLIACVEKVGARPGQGTVSMFSFGKAAGFIEGVLSALGIPYQLVPPRTWKREYSLGNDKGKSIEVCKHLFPDVNLLPTDRCRKESDGMAEAILLAEYARRKFGQK